MRIGGIIIIIIAAVLVVTGGKPEKGLKFVPPVRIPVFLRHLVHIYMGTPLRRMVFTLRFDSNYIYLSHPLDPPSQTWTTHNTFSHLRANATYEPSVYFEDIINFGGEVLRMPIRLSYDTETVDDGVDGILGLGPQSPLWLHWDRFTRYADTLLLGAFDDVLLQLSKGTVGMRTSSQPMWKRLFVEDDIDGYQTSIRATPTKHTQERLRYYCESSTSPSRKQCTDQFPEEYEILVALHSTHTLVPDIFHHMLENDEAPRFDLSALSRDGEAEVVVPVWYGGATHMFSRPPDLFAEAARISQQIEHDSLSSFMTSNARATAKATPSSHIRPFPSMYWCMSGTRSLFSKDEDDAWCNTISTLANQEIFSYNIGVDSTSPVSYHSILRMMGVTTTRLTPPPAAKPSAHSVKLTRASSLNGKHVIVLGEETILDYFSVYHEPRTGVFFFLPLHTHMKRSQLLMASVIVRVVVALFCVLWFTRLYPAQVEGCATQAHGPVQNPDQFGYAGVPRISIYANSWLLDYAIYGGRATLSRIAGWYSGPASTQEKSGGGEDINRSPAHEIVSTVLFSEPSWKHEAEFVCFGIIMTTFVMFAIVMPTILHQEILAKITHLIGNAKAAKAMLVVLVCAVASGPLYAGFAGVVQHPMVGSMAMQVSVLVSLWMISILVFSNPIVIFGIFLIVHILAIVCTSVFVHSVLDALVLYPARTMYIRLARRERVRYTARVYSLSEYYTIPWWRRIFINAHGDPTMLVYRVLPSAVWAVFAWVFAIVGSYPYFFQQVLPSHEATPILALDLLLLVTVPCVFYLVKQQRGIVLRTIAEAVLQQRSDIQDPATDFTEPEHVFASRE